MTRLRQTIQRILAGHEPYPGIVVDRYWNIVLANDAASRMVADLPDSVVGPPLNVFRLCLHPDGLAKRTLNLDEWSTYLLGQLLRASVLIGDIEFQRLIDEVAGYPHVAARGDRRKWSIAEEPQILVPLQLDLGNGELSLFTTITIFGTPQDVTLSELAIELFYPADDASEALLHGQAVEGPIANRAVEMTT